MRSHVLLIVTFLFIISTKGWANNINTNVLTIGFKSDATTSEDGKSAIAHTEDNGFYRANNGITIKCEGAAIGSTGIVDGIEYTKRTRDQITLENAATTCTSGITDMSSLFENEVEDVAGMSMEESALSKSKVSDELEGFGNGLERGFQDKEAGRILEKASLKPEIKLTKQNIAQMLKNADTFNGDISHWDVSSVTNMANMFYGATSFNQDLSNWDVSNVADMSFLFYGASSFDQNINSWVVSNVTNMYGMFMGAKSFNQDLNNWDVSNVTDMQYLFYEAISFNGVISDWDISSVEGENLRWVFYGASSFNQNVNSWDVSRVTSLYSVFNGASAFNQPLNNWDVSNVTDMGYLFYGASLFDQSVNSWDVSNVTRMAGMFHIATAFNQPLNNWDVSNVADMYFMFASAFLFDQDLGNWDVSSVIDMSYIFYFAETFNQDLSGWCVDKFSVIPDRFSEGSALTGDHVPVWGTCPTPQGGPTSTEFEDQIPTEFSLAQNYPNPFNPSTNIRYSIIDKGAVTLAVYNVMGQKVATLVNKTQPVGTYTVTWDAGNISSGVYFYKLDSVGKTIIHQMTLIK